MLGCEFFVASFEALKLMRNIILKENFNTQRTCILILLGIIMLYSAK